jgi:hypothetical protein
MSAAADNWTINDHGPGQFARACMLLKGFQGLAWQYNSLQLDTTRRSCCNTDQQECSLVSLTMLVLSWCAMLLWSRWDMSTCNLYPHPSILPAAGVNLAAHPASPTFVFIPAGPVT